MADLNVVASCAEPLTDCDDTPSMLVSGGDPAFLFGAALLVVLAVVVVGWAIWQRRRS